MTKFGRLGFEKFSPCGRVEKQVFGGHHCTHFERARFGRRHVATDRFDARPMRRTRLPRQNGQSRNGGQTCQRFATKTKACHTLEIIQRTDFARRVAREGQRQISRGNARAIVGDPNTLDTALQELDVDAGGARVETVLE